MMIEIFKQGHAGLKSCLWAAISLFALSACAPSSNGFSSLSSLAPSPSSSSQTPPLATPAPRPSTAANETVCAGPSQTQGIDVSDYDPGTQWSAAQHSGVGFTFIKATEGLTLKNPLFAIDWPAAQVAGVARGAYHYFHPSENPTAQAQFFLQTIGTLQNQDLPPMFDLETTDGMSANIVIQNALTWLSVVQAATGKTPIIYVDPSFFNALGNPSQFASYPLFIAQYGVSCPSIPPPWSNWMFWQSSDTANVSGVQSNADLDHFNGSLQQLSQFALSGWF